MIDDIYTRLLLCAAGTHSAVPLAEKEINYFDAMAHQAVYSQTLQAIYKYNPQTSIGLDYGRQLLPNLCDFSRMMLTGSTPLASLYLWQSLHHVQGTCYFPFVYEDNQQVHVVLTYPYKTQVSETQRRFIAETVFHCLLNFVAEASGARIYADEMCCDYAAPAYAQRYTQELSARVNFKQTLASMALPRTLLLKPCRLFNPMLHEATLARFRQTARQNLEAQRIEYRVVSHMLRYHPAYFSMPALADALHISVRGLQKRLDKSAYSFSDLVKNARHVLALYYSSRGYGQEELAEKLGFKTSSGLRRYLHNQVTSTEH